jgi:hypothetical protein
MALASLFPPLKFRGYDANGKALAGGKLYTYYSGTNVALATYKDKDKVTLNTNPVILNAAGEADVWLDLQYVYRFELRDSNNVQVYVQEGLVADRASSAIGPTGLTGAPGAPGADGVVQQIIGSTNITVDNSDPHRPVIALTGGVGASWTFEQW